MTSNKKQQLPNEGMSNDKILCALNIRLRHISNLGPTMPNLITTLATLYLTISNVKTPWCLAIALPIAFHPLELRSPYIVEMSTITRTLRNLGRIGLKVRHSDQPIGERAVLMAV